MMRVVSAFSLRLLIHSVLLRPLLRIFFGINVEGREHLRGLKNYIIVANHNSHLDVLLLYYVLPKTDILKTHIVAAHDYFSQRPVLFRTVDYLFSPIWIDRKVREADPLHGMRERLTMGHNVIIFPEGTRGEPGEICVFHSGVGRLAEEFKDVPIVPVYLEGPERALPKKSNFPLPLWNSISIGPPQLFTGNSADFVDSLEAFIRKLSESASVSRHKRIKVKPRPVLVAVMGIDGSGKSTLSHTISQQSSADHEVCLISDGLEFFEKGLNKNLRPLLEETLREAIGAYAKNASSLKNYKIPKLAELLLRDHLLGEVRRWYKPDLIVQDGSPLLNLVGWAILYKEDAFNRDACAKALKLLSGSHEEIQESDPIFRDFPELLSIKRLKLAGMHLPDIVIMLDVDPTVCCQRIEGRGQRVQPHETAEKLGKMRRGYLRVCEVVSDELGIPVKVLTGDQGAEEVTRLTMDFIRQEIAREARRDGQGN